MTMETKLRIADKLRQHIDNGLDKSLVKIIKIDEINDNKNFMINLNREKKRRTIYPS